jgi:twitching motility protein PilI
MASSLNLRQYQEGILARLDMALQEGAERHQSFLGVSVGGEHVLVDMSQVTEALPKPLVFPVPNTQHWFLGTANVRGNLYAVNDLAAFLGHEDTDANFKKSDARILLIQPKIATHTAILVERLIGLRGSENLKKVVVEKKDKAQASEYACFFNDKYEDEDGNHWRVLDCHALVNLKGFMQAGLV